MLPFVSTALAAPSEEFEAAIGRMLAAVATVHDATFDLHQQEYAAGRLRDPVLMHIRYRAPNTVYVEWDDGQRLLWIPGDNDDRMRVDPPGLLPPLSLAPDGYLAMRGQRHTVRRLGLAPVADIFAQDRARLVGRPELVAVDDLGTRVLYGRTARCFDARMRKDVDPELYASRVEVCLDVQTWLPVRMTCWDDQDGDLRLVERYGYENLRVNVDLAPTVFDPVALGL